MKKWIIILAFCIFTLEIQSLQVLHNQNNIQDTKTFIWTQESVEKFDELIVSWNATRPSEGYYLLHLSVLVDGLWSPWLKYAQWGNCYQRTFSSEEENSFAKTFQDTLDVLEGQKASGFRVHIEACDGADLNQWKTTHACISCREDRIKDVMLYEEKCVNLAVSHLSQMSIEHPRNDHLCSVAATTAVLRFLKGNREIDPVKLAEKVFDSNFDIYGNWIFCTAQAGEELGDKWFSWVGRIANFDEILKQLQKGIPVVMSLRGPLKGAHLPYKNGHLVAVVGYDPLSQKVLCMDPAFPEGIDKPVSYALNDFLQAAKRRGYMTYFFDKSFD